MKNHLLHADLDKRLIRARTRLLLDQPFFGALCLRQKMMPGPVPTMSTDGQRIQYDPQFVATLTDQELQGVLAHETLHCALAHHCRRGDRDPELWNIAADYAINPLLVENGFALPAGALINPAFTNLSAEEIYTRLPRQGEGGPSSSPGNQGVQGQGPADPHGNGNSQDTESTASNPVGDEAATSGAPSAAAGNSGSSVVPPRPGGFGEIMNAVDEEGKPASPAEMRRQEHEWNIAAEQALRTSQMCGNEPANLARPLTESRESRQDWRAILRDFVQSTSPADFRWSPPNRRYIGSGLYLPSVDRSRVGTIVVGVDTSGSIGTEELAQFAGEISAICDEAQPETIYVVYCDATVQGVQEFGPSDSIELEPKGGGGTDFRPVFEWVDDNDITPACLIYLTDLCCSSYPEPPAYPVLWATDSRETAIFGETVQILIG